MSDFTNSLTSEYAAKFRAHEAGLKSAPTKRDKLYQDIYNHCSREAQKACDACRPTPMVVRQHVNMLDDKSAVAKEYFVPGGVCGFAGVRVRKATCSFAKWVVKNNLGTVSDYYGGVDIKARPAQCTQSMELNEAFAHGWAKAFNELNVQNATAHSWSRMD